MWQGCSKGAKHLRANGFLFLYFYGTFSGRLLVRLDQLFATMTVDLTRIQKRKPND